MTLPPLASLADVVARGVAVTPEEETMLATALDVASAAVRAAAGAVISESTDTVVLQGDPAARLRLPGGPITAVADVLLDGVPATGWHSAHGALWRSAGWGTPSSEVTVTYTHGLPVVPADIVDLVCRMAVTALIAQRKDPAAGGLSTQRVQSERAGEYSVSYAYPTLISEQELPDYLRARLAARFGGSTAVVVRAL